MSTASLPPRPGPRNRLSSALPLVPQPVTRFLVTEAGSGFLLLAAAIAALVWANVPGGSYEWVWETTASIQLGDYGITLDLQHWINDAAMAIFFLTVGLEINREVTVGELRRRRYVMAPIFGAAGGVIVPALIFYGFNAGTPAEHGWGIPISTDTAFLLGILALFGPRCPDQLRLFFLTLAIVDDIVAILVLAIFYTPELSMVPLIVAIVLTAVLFGLRWAGVWQLRWYGLVGIALWFAIYESGLHGTLAGVILGLLVPATPTDPRLLEFLRFYGRGLIERADAQRARLTVQAARATVPANDRMQDVLHPFSAYVIVPVFALANAGVVLNAESLSRAARSPVTIGILVALVVGKTVGISLGTAIALWTKLGELPGRVRYGHLIGGAALAGIGFTISLFIAGLAYDDPVLNADAKIGVLVGSVLAAVIGSLALRYLGERLPLCMVEDDEAVPALPTGPWTDPTRP
ncbi:Na(+)/H(+) antiporter NhaA [Asanoa ishikariensis]|uniref:Na(+)/H(+) antiporter NhaA n=1 Tax=Asanoa ishikariensis TaxID=137265 RepID=A0A1H3TS55_9ACTN|nr:Na+/H+ antiporter NhaA [Asanoa ishikariensis]GIF67350.1 Na(+)/H(+) antiporter NhaA [Asanoa ishikariensis]SDZ52738.1 sodium/proton antiporter, NhaA family [Asanoa ishikariensis]